MDTWNYRVVRHTFDAGAGDESLYAIHEVYYNGDGTVAGITEHPVRTWGENVEELREEFSRILQALDRPVLEYSDFRNQHGEVNFNTEEATSEEEGEN